jgi:hypothetical protein
MDWLGIEPGFLQYKAIEPWHGLVSLTYYLDVQNIMEGAMTITIQK